MGEPPGIGHNSASFGEMLEEVTSKGISRLLSRGGFLTLLASSPAGPASESVNMAALSFSSSVKSRFGPLNEETFSAAAREARGEVVARRPDGKPFDHIAKIRQESQGLKRDLQTVKKALGRDDLSTATRKELQDTLSAGSKLLDRATRELKKIEELMR